MRSRNIKPGFFENEKLAELDPLARILFAGLWCYADREGRFEWRPKRIKALILPYDNCDIECLLLSLDKSEHVKKYTVGDNDYGYILNFTKHQNPHPHEAKSIIPEPSQCHDLSVTLHGMSAKCNADIMIPDSLIPDSKRSAQPPPLQPTPKSETKHFSANAGSFLKRIEELATQIQNMKLKKRFNVWQVVQGWANAKRPPPVIVEVLEGVLDLLPDADDPYPYIQTAMKQKAYKFKCRLEEAEHQKEKEFWNNFTLDFKRFVESGGK